MGLMKCPDCKSEVSDRLDACPKCGCPFTEEIKKEALQAEEQKVNDEEIDEITQEQNTKIINQQNEVEETNNNPSVNSNWKKVKIAVIIVVIAAIVIGGIVFALNFKKMQINKANKLIEQTQYSEAVKVLEKYKDDDDVKKLYDDAAYMASDEGQFLTAFAKGLMQRWELNLSTPDTNDSATYIANMQKLINAELNEISKYRDVTFSNDTFNQKAHDYINDLDKQMDSLNYYTTDYNKYANEWSDAYGDRSLIISYFLNNYPVKIDDKYADIKNEVASVAKLAEESKVLEKDINNMINAGPFELAEDSYGYKTYKKNITNTTKYTFEYFGLNVQCLDDSKNIIDQEYTGQIKSFAPGQTATLEFTTDKSPSSFNVEAEYSIKGE